MPRDIEPEYTDLPAAVIRGMTGAERMRIVFELTARMRRKIWNRIEEEHPDWPIWQKKVEFMRWIFDPEPLPRGLEESMRGQDDPPWF
ncbi:MAG TPA: hypothetical protein VEX86_15520 [Longimicrobium sp.]|nr:hypothetical protein [Longimicrobium sp.]